MHWFFVLLEINMGYFFKEIVAFPVLLYFQNTFFFANLFLLENWVVIANMKCAFKIQNVQQCSNHMTFTCNLKMFKLDDSIM